MKIIQKEINALTGEEIISEREETAEETKNRLDLEKDLKAAKALAEAKAAEKAAVFVKLGLTAEEVAALLS